MQVHSLISSGKYEKKNLAQLYNIFFSISINYSKNFNSYLEIYFSSILDIIKHKIFKNESDLQEDYKTIIEAQINKSFSVIDNKRNKKIQSSGYLILILCKKIKLKLYNTKPLILSLVFFYLKSFLMKKQRKK
jgi:hypothetical protein